MIVTHVGLGNRSSAIQSHNVGIIIRMIAHQHNPNFCRASVAGRAFLLFAGALAVGALKTSR